MRKELRLLEILYAPTEKIECTIKTYNELKSLLVRPTQQEMQNQIIKGLNKELGNGFIWVYKYNSFMNKTLKIHIFIGKANMVENQLLGFEWAHNEFTDKRNIRLKDLSLETLNNLIEYYKYYDGDLK